MVQDRVDDPLIEDRVGEYIDKEDFPLSNRKAEEVERNLVGRSVEDGGHDGTEKACFRECLISSTSWGYLNWYQTASACPSNPGWCSVVPRR